MNKKLMYAALAILLVLVTVFAFNVWKNYSDNNSASDNKIDTIEEAPILGNKDDAPANKPENTAEPTGEPKDADEIESNETKLAATSADYETFMNMSSEEQQKYVASFSSIDAFFDWYNAAKKAYELENPPIEVGNGVIDMGEIIKEKN